MPFDHEIDPQNRIVIVRVRECASPNEAISTARQLVKDDTIDASFAVLIVVGEITDDAAPEELRELAEVLKLAGRKFRGRKAIVATHPGRVTAARIVALIASTHDDVEAFTAEDAARAWLLSGQTR